MKKSILRAAPIIGGCSTTSSVTIAVLSETRSAVWSSAKKGSTEPLQNWFKNFKSMGIMGMIGYIYGIYHLGEKIDTYLSKKD